MKPENPPAFPMPDTYNANNDCQPGHTGMTLRDYFAAKAMQSLILYDDQERAGDYVPSIVAKSAYAMADAMLEARAK